MMRVAILGVTGELGSRVARLMQRWVPEVQIIGANHSGRGHPDFPVQAIAIEDEAALSTLASQVQILVNCVGPYDHDPGPVIRACVSNGCHYADLAEVPAFVERVHALARATGARQKEVVICSGCSTMPGLAQLIASSWHDRMEIASVEAFLVMASKSPATRSLMTGLSMPLGRKGKEGRWYARLHRVNSVDGRSFTCGSYPAALSEGGIRLGERQVPFFFRMGFDRGWISRGIALAAPLLGMLPKRWVTRCSAVMVPIARFAAVFGTARGIFIQIAHDAAGREVARVEVVASSAGLDIPAAPPLWLAQALQRPRLRSCYGAVDLGQIVQWDDALAWFEKSGYEVRER